MHAVTTYTIVSETRKFAKNTKENETPFRKQTWDTPRSIDTTQL